MAVSPPSRNDSAQALETAVYLELRRRTASKAAEITSYRTQNGYELDFAVSAASPRELANLSAVEGVRKSPGTLELYQVSENISEPRTRNRELRALFAAMEETNVAEGHLLTLNNDEIITDEARTITVLPAWKWILRNAGIHLTVGRD
jgi:predicted AAA+ superfamily ATPase